MDVERDAQLAAAYRALEPAAPPPVLDDAILAAARRAVSARPRAAGAPFAGRWQMPLSIAAVVVVCVSLVTVMRDEGGDLTQPPRAEAPATVARDAAEGASAVAKIELAPAARSKNLGLKPPASAAAAEGADQYALAAPAPPAGMRAPTVAGESAAATVLKQPVEAGAVASSRAAAPGQRERAPGEFVAPPPAMAASAPSRADTAPAAEPAPAVGAAAAPAGAAARRADAADRLERDTARLRTQPTETQTAATQSQARPAAAPQAAGGLAQAKAAPAPARAAEAAAKDGNREAAEVTQMANLQPEKWLERIEALRGAGRLVEARAGLAAFRQRYPDYTLPAALREWAER
jgi:hypothetical protein